MYFINSNNIIFFEEDLSKLFSKLKPLSDFTVTNIKWNNGQVIRKNNIIEFKQFGNIIPLDVTLIDTILRAFNKRKQLSNSV